jgi:hypothetical protein
MPLGWLHGIPWEYSPKPSQVSYKSNGEASSLRIIIHIKKKKKKKKSKLNSTLALS